VRRFDAEYLRTTRAGMWAESREALTDLALDQRASVLDVGCGTGVLTRVLAEECLGEVMGSDADPSLLAGLDLPAVAGDATRLPFRDDAVELVVCQALLINLPEPADAVAEFARVASDAVAVVEPDNSAVTVESTVDAEARLARRAREFYLDGVGTDVALGADGAELLADAGIDVLSTRRYEQVRSVAPPYSEDAVEAARRKATGEGLADDRAEILAGDATSDQYDELREAWRAMGRDVVDQMAAGSYERTESVPFFISVGRL
jgi:SAM-dependent methyltransferase